MKENLFLEKRKQNPFLIMSHRGFWGGNIIENTIEAAFLAFKAGADVVEVDVCRTTDQKYYLFHDGNEQKLLARSKNFKEFFSKEVDDSEVYNSIGSNSGYKINTLSHFLDWLPENKLVNIDRSWDYWQDDAFFEIIRKSGKQDQLVLKSPVEKEYLDLFSEKGIGLYYMPIVQNKAEIDLVLSYPVIHTIGLEIVVNDAQSDLLNHSLMKQYKQAGLLVIANSEKLGSEFHLFGDFDDDTSLFQDNGWHGFVSLGIDVIQTDWPNFLYEYREKLKQVGE